MRYVRIIFILLLVFVVNSCSNEIDNEKTSDTNLVETENYIPDSENIKVYKENKSLKEISQELFEIYLKRFKESNVSEEVRIDDYTIHDIKIENESESNYTFYVTYSIKPSTDNYVLAGNGIESEDGWIVERSYFIKVGKIDEYYTITGIGTGP